MNKYRIKVSFIIIAYNIESYISKCIETVKMQTLKEIEIIIINDGSVDSTLSKIECCVEGDSRIKVFTQKNSGANEARKLGLKYATGEYIVFVDGDDWVDKNLALELYELASTTNVDIISYNFYKAYEQRVELFKDNYYEDIIIDNNYLKLILSEKITHNIWNKFIKREFAESTNIKNMIGITMGDDLVANVELGICKPKVLVIEKAYYYYYQRETSVTKKSSNKMLEMESALVYIEELLKKYKLLQLYKEEIDFLWIIHFYIMRVVLTDMKIDSIHKKIYKLWKDKNININNNSLYIDSAKQYKISEKILVEIFNANYYLGCFAIFVKRGIKGIIK